MIGQVNTSAVQKSLQQEENSRKKNLYLHKEDIFDLDFEKELGQWQRIQRKIRNVSIWGNVALVCLIFVSILPSIKAKYINPQFQTTTLLESVPGVRERIYQRNIDNLDSTQTYRFYFDVKISDCTPLSMRFLMKLNPQQQKGYKEIQLRYILVDPTFIDADNMEKYTLDFQATDPSTSVIFSDTQIYRNQENTKIYSFLTMIDIVSPKQYKQIGIYNYYYYYYYNLLSNDSFTLRMQVVYADNGNSIKYITKNCRYTMFIMYIADLERLQYYNFTELYVRYDKIQNNIEEYYFNNNGIYNQPTSSKPSIALYGINKFSLNISNSFSQQFYIYTYPNLNMLNINPINTINTAQISFFSFIYGKQKCLDSEYRFEKNTTIYNYQNNISQVLPKCYRQCNRSEYMIAHGFQGNDIYSYYTCQKCSTNCSTCTDKYICSSCDTSWGLELKPAEIEIEKVDSQGNTVNQTIQAVVCVVKEGFFFVQTHNHGHKCSQSTNNCLTCNKFNEGKPCYSCSLGYYLDEQTQQCVKCSEQYHNACILCDQYTCLACYTGFQLINGTQCDKIRSIILPDPPKEDLLPCDDLYNCQLCNQSNVYHCFECFSQKQTIVDGKCETVCGDKKIHFPFEECDDGNGYSFDGCSSDCMIEDLGQEKWQCFLWPSYVGQQQGGSQDGDNQGESNDTEEIETNDTEEIETYTTCYYLQVMKVQSIKITKETMQNVVRIKLNLSEPLFKLWMIYQQIRDLSELFEVSWLNKEVYKNYGFNANFYFGDDPSLAPSYQSSQNYQKDQRRLLQPQTRLLNDIYSDYNKSGKFTTQYMTQHFSTITLDLYYYPLTSTITPVPSLSLNHMPITITFKQPVSSGHLLSRSPTFTPSQQFSTTFPLVTSNNQIIQYYDEQSYYTLYGLIKLIGLLVSGISILMLLLSLIVSGCEKGSYSTLIALEYSGIVQFTYYSMIAIGQLNPLFVALILGLIYSNLVGIFPIMLAFNPQKNEGSFSGIDKSLQSIGYLSPHFADNSAISVSLILVPSIIGIIMKIIAQKCLKERQVQNQFRLEEHTNNNNLVADQNLQNLENVGNLQNINNPTIQQEQNLDRPAIIQAPPQNQPPQKRNIGFPLFMFFSYNIFTSLMIQIFYAPSMDPMDMVFIGLGLVLWIGYLIGIFCNFEIYESLMMKLHKNRQQNNEPQQLQNSPTNRFPNTNPRQTYNKKIYLLLSLLQRPINGIILILLTTHSTPLYKLTYNAHSAFPIILSIVIFVILIKRSTIPLAHIFRLLVNLFCFCLIQAMLLYRSVAQKVQYNNNKEEEESASATSSTAKGTVVQSFLSRYLPVSIALGLLLAGLISLSYFIYSVKRTRCCQLQIQRYKRVSTTNKNVITIQLQQCNEQLQAPQPSRPQQLQMVEITNGIRNANGNISPNSIHDDQDVIFDNIFDISQHNHPLIANATNKATTKVDKQKIKQNVKAQMNNLRLKSHHSDLDFHVVRYTNQEHEKKISKYQYTDGSSYYRVQDELKKIGIKKEIQEEEEEEEID